MHHLQLAEAFPLAPGGAGILTGLATLFTVILWAIAIGLLIVWRRTVGALFEHLADLLDRVSIHTGLGTIRPLGFVAGALREADWAVQQGLDDAVHGSERAIVYLWGATTWFFRLTGHMVRGLAHDTETAFQILTHSRIPKMILWALVPPAAAIAALRSLVHRHHARTTHDITHLRDDVHSIGHSTTVVLPRGIARNRARESWIEREFDGVKSRLRKVEGKLRSATFVGAVALALSTLGLGFLRCPSFMRLGRRLGCGGFAFIEGLLFGAIEAFVVTDLCRYTGFVTEAAVKLRPLLMDFVDVEEALVGCHDAKKPTDLSIPAVRLPPTNAGLPLAA